MLNDLENSIFKIKSVNEFNDIALKIFQYQYFNNPVYKAFVDFQNIDFQRIRHFQEIPFLPIEFFKDHKIICENPEPEIVFTSSGTSGIVPSKHYVAKTALYEQSLIRGFEYFYGTPENYIFLALLPSYLERKGSSLVYMVDKLMHLSGHNLSNFYLDNLSELATILKHKRDRKTVLIGVTFALLDLAENFDLNIPEVIVMETGGMKGRRKEMIRQELHDILKSKFNMGAIHSEYGMTELLSQAYSQGDGIFRSPPWMKILVRDINDPKTLLNTNQTGGINVIDLANIYSCSFIATQDLGKLHHNGNFEVIGRFDNSDIRGCNLMVV